jgi:hypothetical protein
MAIEATPSAKARESVPAAFDESAFAARLWVWPPRPVETVAAAPPPPPVPPPAFTLQLVGIEREGVDALAALLYDPAALKITRLGAGESMGRYRVESIDQAGAVLADTVHPGRPMHTLRLRMLGHPKTPLRVVRGSGEERSP